MKYVNREFINFISVGLANTLFTYIFYVILLMYLSYTLSYTIAYLAGIAISYGLNSIFVFHEPMSWRKGVCFPVIYAALYAFSIVTLWVFVEVFSIHTFVAPLLVIAITVPVAFILSRYVIKGKVWFI